MRVEAQLARDVQPASTLTAGKISRNVSWPKFFASLASPQAFGATMNDSYMKGTGR